VAAAAQVLLLFAAACLAAVSLPTWPSTEPAGEGAGRSQYRCKLSDGSLQMADRNLAREFPLAVSSCRRTSGGPLSAVSPAVPDAGGAGQFRCTLTDGSLQMADRDLAPQFPLAVRVCRPLSSGSLRAVMVRSVDTPVTSLAVVPKDATATLPPDDESPMNSGTPGAGTVAQRQPVASLIRAAAVKQGLDPDMVSALVYVESRYNVGARSPKGAIGLMQIMPATGARYGVASPQALLDPRVNIDVGTRYLRDLSRMFPGRNDLVLAAYNAGEGAVRKCGNRVPPYKETQAYVLQIMTLWGKDA
jgi:hypothetical protein